MTFALLTRGLGVSPQQLLTQGLLAGEAVPQPPADETRPTGGWRAPPGWDRHETAEMRRRERERLGIEPPQQRAIDRAATKIAKSMPNVGLAAPLEARQAVLAAPAFDALLMVLRPSEGEIMDLVQAILNRLAWMQAEQEEEEAVVRLLMEMD